MRISNDKLNSGYVSYYIPEGEICSAIYTVKFKFGGDIYWGYVPHFIPEGGYVPYYIPEGGYVPYYIPEGGYVPYYIPEGGFCHWYYFEITGFFILFIYLFIYLFMFTIFPPK